MKRAVSAVLRVHGEIDGGVHFMITPTLSLRMDAKQLLLNQRGEYEFDLRPSIGFGWKF